MIEVQTTANHPFSLDAALRKPSEADMRGVIPLSDRVVRHVAAHAAMDPNDLFRDTRTALGACPLADRPAACSWHVSSWRMVGREQHNLRQYESCGVLEPYRTWGGTPIYSGRDVAELRRTSELLTQGVNSAGIRLVLQREVRSRQLSNQMRRLQDRA